MALPNSPRGFNLSIVPPGQRIWHSGHSFERLTPEDEAASGRCWLHHSPDPEAPPHPTDLHLFEADRHNNATFAMWGRVVVEGSEVIGYSDPDYVIHMLGSSSLLEAEVSAPDDASQLMGLPATGGLVQGGGET